MRGRPRATVIRTDTTMTSKIARPLDLLRLVGGVVLLVLGLIAVVPSPNDWVWLLGVLVTEGGHWALVACLPLFARELFIGVSSPAVRVEDHLFASIDGQELRLDLYRPAEDHAPLPGVI